MVKLYREVTNGQIHAKEMIDIDMLTLLSKIRDAKSLLAVTGAGVSAESGIPTYRDVIFR